MAESIAEKIPSGSDESVEKDKFRLSSINHRILI